MTKTERILRCTEEMNANCDYFGNARTIWSLLSSEERAELTQIVTLRPAVFDGYVTKNPVRQNLLDCKLATKVSLNGEYGYVLATFSGYAAYRTAYGEDRNALPIRNL